jgi:hypothetical protein
MIMNVTGGTKKIPLPPAQREQARPKWYGFMDYMDGLDYRQDYESWGASAQKNYEAGRCLAAVVKYEWGQPIEWDPNRRLGEVVLSSTDSEVFAAVYAENEWHVRHAVKKPAPVRRATRRRRSRRY